MSLVVLRSDHHGLSWPEQTLIKWKDKKVTGYPNLLTLTAILIEMLCKKVDNLQGNKGSDKL